MTTITDVQNTQECLAHVIETFNGLPYLDENYAHFSDNVQEDLDELESLINQVIDLASTGAALAKLITEVISE